MISSQTMHKAARAFGACCALLILAVFSSAASAQAGYVHEASGLVSIQRGAAKAEPAKAGDAFESETIFRTGTDGRVTLKFADGQIVALGFDSALRIGQYRYVAGNLRQSSSAIELIKGEMRFVTGLIGAGNREVVRITAGKSIVSIQKSGGADFIVRVDPDPEEVGHAVVARGEISVRTPYGRIVKIAENQYVPWRPGRTPPPPVPLAAAPAMVQAATANLWATALPANTPVAVAPAAQTAGTAAAIGPAMAQVGAEAMQAGYVDAVSNVVSIRTSSGATVAANVGTTFEAGTAFSTGSDGRVVLKFADGQIVVLGPNSVLAVDQYRFDPNNVKASRSALDLVNGAMRFISGNIHTENHEGINITAGASIVDILNTGPADFTVVVDTRNQEVGVARVSTGEIAVHTPYGPIDRIESNKSNLWGPRKTPTSPIAIDSALAVVQAAVTLQLSGLPDTRPVAVEAAASAAAAAAAAAQAQALANAKPENAQLRAAAQAAAEEAKSEAQAAAAANEAMAAKILAAMLQDLPPASAGPALAQIEAAPAPLPIVPILLPTTPGAGGGCTGSLC